MKKYPLKVGTLHSTIDYPELIKRQGEDSRRMEKTENNQKVKKITKNYSRIYRGGQR